MRSISHAILLSPLFPKPQNGLSFHRGDCQTGSTSHSRISTTRARLAGMRVDSLLTGRAWLRPAAESVERLASEPGGLVLTTVTGSPRLFPSAPERFPGGSAVAKPVRGAFPLPDIVGDHARRFSSGLCCVVLARKLA